MNSYAAFAYVLGAAIVAITRRTLPAMALVGMPRHPDPACFAHVARLSYRQLVAYQPAGRFCRAHRA